MSQDDRKRYLILKDPNIYKGLILLAIPLMINNLIRTLHDVIDMFFVSDIPGKSAEALSAINMTFPVVFTFISFGMGLSIAGTSLISQFVGSKQIEDARKYASNLVVISLLIGIFFMLLSFFMSPLIMRLMGTEGFVFENSVTYLRIRAFELPVIFLFFAFTAIRQSTGDTITPVIYGVVTMVVNIILSPIFISVLDLGVAGAAYATLIANVVIMPFGFMHLVKSKSGITITKEFMIIDKEISWHIIKTAIPASFGQAITAIGFGVMNGIIYSYGVDTVAAFSIGNRLSSIILHPVMAIGGVLAAYIGQNIGNLNPKRAKETFKKSMILSFTLMAIGSALLLNFREFFASFFIKDNPVALALATEYMFYLLIGLPLMGIFQTFIGTFNGTGNTHFTFIVTITRLWLLRIPLVVAFKYLTNLDSSGVWYAMLISNFSIAFVGLFLYQFVDFKPKVRIRKNMGKPIKKPIQV